ncbi:MAG: antibiotic biosynthesis monooxygenase [Candidatus Acidiferrales bacterium]
MIVRVWRGRVAASNERAYIEHLTRRVFPGLRTVDGFLGASLLKEGRADGVEFLVLTRWASMDAIRVFAGPNASTAVVEPAAAAILLDFDRVVRHYEVAAEVSGVGSS